MKKLLIVIFFIFSYQVIIDEAVYNLMYNNYYFSYENKNITVTNNMREEINSNFRIKKSSQNLDTQYYYLEHINTNLNLLLSPKNQSFIQLNFTNITKIVKKPLNGILLNQLIIDIKFKIKINVLSR